LEQFLFLLIIAAISFIFKRKTGVNQKQQEQHMPPPVAKPIQTYYEKVEEPARSTQQVFPELTKARNLQEVADILIAEAQPTVNEKQEELMKKIDELKVEEEKHRVKVNKIKQINDDVKHEQVPELHFQANDILKGIVMSEVLGPPRSLKPYDRLKRS